MTSKESAGGWPAIAFSSYLGTSGFPLSGRWHRTRSMSRFCSSSLLCLFLCAGAWGVSRGASAQMAEANNRTGDDATTRQAAAAKVQMLMERLKSGAPFSQLAMDYSEDPQS